MKKANRIVFRHRNKTIECYELDGAWHCSVQGEKAPRGPFKSPGKAVQEGISTAEKHSAIRGRIQQRRQSTQLDAIIRKASS